MVTGAPLEEEVDDCIVYLFQLRLHHHHIYH